MSTRKPPRWTKPANHRGILVFDSRNNLEQVKPSTSSKNIAHIESQLRELTAYSDNGDAAEPGTRLNPHYIGDMAPNADSKSLHGDIGQPDRLSKNDLCVVCDFSPVFQERQRQKASLLAKTEYNFGAATIDRDRLWELSKKSANPSMLESLKSDVHSKSLANVQDKSDC